MIWRRFIFRTIYFFKKHILLLLYRAKGIKVLTRKQFIRSIPSLKSLEIGPFASPCITGPQVDYFDVLDQDSLRKRANHLHLSEESCPFIKYVSSSGDLSIVEETYQIIFSCHCIEHQPDLILHLKSVEQLLHEKGFYYLAIPDKRYCMDAFLPESGISEVLQAHEQKRKLHTLRSVIEHYALTTHNEAWRHWMGFHGSRYADVHQIRNAIEEFNRNPSAYIDVHAWQFTPASFAGIISILRQMKYISLSVEKIYPTRPGSFEFYAVLKKSR